MNSRHLIIAWIASISIFLAFSAFAIYLGSHRPINIPSTNLENVDVVVIGSSLTQAAIPAFEGGSALFDDGRPYERLLVGAIDEAKTLALLEHSVEAGVSTIIVEANDFIYDRVERTWQGRVSFFAAGLAAEFRRGVKLLKGIPIPDLTFREGDIPDNTTILEGDKPNFKPRFKFIVKKDRNAILESVIGGAKQKSIDVIFFVPPFSQLYTKGLKGDVESIYAQADALAGSLRIRFWRASTPWEDPLFRDVAHLNVWGRERFMGEFGHWLRSAP